MFNIYVQNKLNVYIELSMYLLKHIYLTSINIFKCIKHS